MQEQVYVDMFATKGVEYMLVIGFLFAFVLFWRLLSPPTGRAQRSGSPVQPLSGTSRWFAVPRDRSYHPGHSWARADSSGVVTVGIDDFAQKLIGRPTAIQLPEIGTQLTQGERASSFEVDTKSIDLLSPVDGDVISQNPTVLQDPQLINRDPYGDGWLMKVRPSRMMANFKSLLHEGLAAAWMETTEDELRRMMSTDLGVVLQDGGVPVTGIARNLSRDNWELIAQEFLLTAEPGIAENSDDASSGER